MVRSVVSLLSICFSSHYEANLLLFLLLLFLMKRVNKLEAVNIRSQSKRRFLGEEKVDVPQCTLGFRKERDHVLCCCYAKIGTWLGVCNTYLVLFHLSFEPWSRQILLLLLFFFPFIVFSHSIHILLQRILIFRCAQSKTDTQRRSSYIQIDSRSKYRDDTQNKQSAILKTVGGLGKGLQTYRHHNVMSTALLEGMHNRHKNASEANNFHESYVYFMYTRYMFEFHTGKFQSAFWDSTE